jgi:hypothetical protein
MALRAKLPGFGHLDERSVRELKLVAMSGGVAGKAPQVPVSERQGFVVVREDPPRLVDRLRNIMAIDAREDRVTQRRARAQDWRGFRRESAPGIVAPAL